MTKPHVITTVAILGLVYFLLFQPASNGYGYYGYRGYNKGASRWYMGGPRTYYDRNNRGGSISGSGRRGGGPGSGK